MTSEINPDDLLPRTWLTAYRPDAHRFERMARLIKEIETRIAADPDPLAYQRWIGGLLALADSKGDLTAIWRSEADQASYAAFLDAAWKAEGEKDGIEHRVGHGEFDEFYRYTLGQ